MESQNKKSKNRRNAQQLEHLQNSVFNMLQEGKHELEIMVQHNLSKAQFKSYLADFLHEVLEKNRERKKCEYEAAYASALPEAFRKQLGIADKNMVIKSEKTEGGIFLTIIPLDVTDVTGDDDNIGAEA